MGVEFPGTGEGMSRHHAIIVLPVIKKRIYRLLPNWLVDLLARVWLTSPFFVKAGLGKPSPDWKARIQDVCQAPDNQRISRVADAGEINGFYITMHNGVKVCANGYYGHGILNMLVKNKGVHEPQEEWAFEEILDHVPPCCEMLELGAYWGFYSLSLLKRHPTATCHLVEPNRFYLASGKLNFEINGCQGDFLQAMVAAVPSDQPKSVSVDSFCDSRKIKRLHILHSDIQGYEVEMLKGASAMLGQKRVDYVFISTHSNELHKECIRILKQYEFVILASADLDESYSHDGLIVAKQKDCKGPGRIDISIRAQNHRG
jgi:hypothetical protein